MRIVFRLAVTVIILLSLAGCSRDPNVRKQRLLNSGNDYLKKGEYSAASIQFRKALRIDPRFAAAHYQLAKADLQLKDWSNAYKELQATVDLQPDNVGAQLDLGNVALAGRDLKAAQQVAFALLQRNSDNADAHALMANVNQAQGHHDEAMTEIDKAISLQPQRAQFHLNRGIFLASRRQPEAAENSLRRATTLDPKLATAFVALSELYLQQQRWPEAQQVIQARIGLEPTSIQARLMSAKIYLAQENRSAAEQVLVQAAKDLPDDPNACRLLPEFHQSLGEMQKALVEFAKLHDRHPQDSTTSVEYAQLLLESNQADDAAKVNDATLKRDPHHSGARIVQAELLMHAGKQEEAIALLQGVIRDEPGNAFAHFQLGIALSQTGDNERAESEWRQTAQLKPDMLVVERLLGRIALAKQDYELLAEVAQQLLTYDSKAVEGYVYRASVAARNKQLDRVDSDLKRAMQVASQNSLGFTAMGDWRMSQKQYAEAEKYYEEALLKDRNSADALHGLVHLYKVQNQPARALARVRTQIADAPDNSDFHFLLANLQIDSKDFAGAEESLLKAVSLNRKNGRAYYALGQVQTQRGASDKALATSYEWLKYNPKDVRAYVLGGALEDEKGNWRAAQELYRKALQVHPNDPAASNNLAYSMLENGGNVDVALSLAQTARSAAPKAPVIADTLAWAYYHKGAYGTAATMLKEAMRADPNNALYHFHLGMVYAKTHNPAGARAQFQKALQEHPNVRQAELIRDQLQALGG